MATTLRRPCTRCACARPIEHAVPDPRQTRLSSAIARGREETPMSTTPRLAPLPEAQWDDDTRKMLEASKMHAQVLNIFAPLAHHPDLLRRWMVFGTHVLLKSTVGPRERELVILRTGWNCRAEYEWGQHVVIAKQIGISDEEIERIRRGPE